MDEKPCTPDPKPAEEVAVRASSPSGPQEPRCLEVEPLDEKPCTPDPNPGVEAMLDPATENVDPAEAAEEVAVRASSSDPVEDSNIEVR